MRYAAAALAFIALTFVGFASSDRDPAELRARGPMVIDELLAKNVDDALLDQVCAQKDCRSSQLYWYTDFEQAKAESRRTGKPILSLRLLGRLDEEVSCANSRFFRTILYPDPSIAPLLRNEFVLHWESVRPVPKITIEMGDGRVIRQTITGNSVHYLLDEHGAVLDVLPGMVSPAAFHTQLETWIDANRTNDWRAYHAQALSRSIETRTQFMPTFFPLKAKKPTAREAAARAMTKGVLETPVLVQLSPEASMRELPQSMWESIGEDEKTKVVFSQPALELMARKQPLTDAMLDRLRASIAADTVLNQQELHYRIHEWFLEGKAGDLAKLNQRVYAKLFLTPLDDPWMGLKPAAAFAAMKTDE